MITIEDMPNWLRDWTPRRPNAVVDFFASRVVYYPGSGTDGQPVQFFGSRHAAHCFVFADYGIPMAHVLQELGEGGGIPLQAIKAWGAWSLPNAT